MSKSKSLVEGPLGFKTTEEAARQMERLLAVSPKASYKHKALPAEVQFEPGERASVDIVTTDNIDHENEVVLPGGIDVSTFRMNPIVLFAHDDTKPIGRSQWIKTSANGIKSKTIYASRPDDFQGDFLPDLVFALVQQQILKGRSIGFFATQIDAPTQEQLTARPDWANARCIITKSMIYEYSVVSVPCNEFALQEAVSKGLKQFSTKSLEALGVKVAPTQAESKKANVTLAKIVQQIAKPKLDEKKLLLQMLEKIQVNPDAIAKQVLEQLRNRGRV
jgi:hypothetical protein